MRSYKRRLQAEESKHHRCPKSLRGRNEERNISIVPNNKHQAWHLLFANKTPREIVGVINETWGDPNWKFVAVRRE